MFPTNVLTHGEEEKDTKRKTRKKRLEMGGGQTVSKKDEMEFMKEKKGKRKREKVLA